MKKQFLLAGSLALSALPAAAQTSIIFEDFESYADTAAMEAVWGPTTGAGELRTGEVGNAGNAAYHPGGAINQITGFSVAPSASENVKLSFDMYDSGTSSRLTVGLRQAGGTSPLFELGIYNAPARYSTRILNFAGNPNWVSLSGTAVVGWHHWEALFTANDVTVSLDLNSDSTIDFTYTSTGSFSVNPFGDLRFGGPSALSSAGPAYFDNISLSLVPVPEPSTWALLGLGAAGLWLRGRRRNG